jgi:integrase/ribosomal protein L40E
VHVFLKYAAPELAKYAVIRSVRTTKMPEEMLDQEEVEKLIEAAQTNRDRALIAFLYESGVRKGELLSIRIENVKFDENGAIVVIPKGKTGPRRIRIVFSSSFLKQWLDTHPRKKERTAYLFCSLHQPYNALSFTGLRYQIKCLSERAGIDKRTYPHLFRHSCATHLAGHLTEQQLKIYLGWTPGSNMAANYVHLSGRDIDPAILALNGIAESQKSAPDMMQTTLCPRCHERQPVNGEFCFKCSYPLSKQAIDDEVTTEALISKLMEKPEFTEMFLKYMSKKSEE